MTHRSLLRSSLALVLISGVLAVGFAGSARADASDLAVTYQINVAHTGLVAGPGLSLPFSRRWQVTFPGPVSYPLIARGMVYVTAGDSSTPATLYALNQQTGQLVWSRPLGFSPFLAFSGAAYDAGRVYVVGSDLHCCDNGLMRAFAADTGELLWTTTLPWNDFFSSPPTAANGVVYTSGDGGSPAVYAVDEASGALLARAPVTYGDDSSPALSDTGVFVSYACNQAFGFARTTLTQLWHHDGPCAGGGGKTVVYANGHVYTRDYFGNLILDAATGLELGPLTSPGITSLPPAFDSTRMFMLSYPTGILSPRTLTAQPADGGAALWTFTGDGGLDTAPIVIVAPTGEVVIEGSSSGMVYALDAATGAVVWSIDVGTAIPEPVEQSPTQPLTGLGAGQGVLVVPTRYTLSGYVTDTTAPSIVVPDSVGARATSAAGAPVSYVVTATDPDDEASVGCRPPSGGTFPVGTTTVMCTATDTAGNKSVANFVVVVSGPGADCDLAHYPAAKGALNLKNANLSGCNLRNVDLTGANATNANLSGAYLDGSSLARANLSQANLSRAVLTRADLTGATWSQTTCPDGTNSNVDGGTCEGHLG